jgi:predicted porin
MKFNLRIAAAGTCLLAGFTLPQLASAADSVTLYGILDNSVQYVNHGPGGSSRTSMSSGGWNGSRWGMRGSEDLGNGTKAIFALESGIDVNNGQTLQGGRLFGRQSWVGLSDKTLGQLTMGRHNTLMLDWMSKYTPFDNATISAKVLDASFSDRMDNSVKYSNKFGPVTVGTYYSFGWNNDQNYDDKAVGRMWGAGARYKENGWDAALLYHTKHADKPKTGADGDNREDRVVAGLAYDMDIVKVYLGYRWLEQKLVQRNYTSNLYWAGIDYKPSHPTTLSLAILKMDGTACDSMNYAACPAVQEAGSAQKPTMIIAGAQYDLSKRTTLYALGGYALNSHGSSVSVIGGNYGVNVEPGQNQFGLSVGMRHRF